MEYTMLELLSPAGSPEAVIAAVQNGADAVYLGLSDFNARRGAAGGVPQSSKILQDPRVQSICNA